MAARRASAGPRSTARSSARAATRAKSAAKRPATAIMRRPRRGLTEAPPPGPSRDPSCRGGGARCRRCGPGRGASRSPPGAPGARARAGAASGVRTTARSRGSPSRDEARRAPHTEPAGRHRAAGRGAAGRGPGVAPGRRRPTAAPEAAGCAARGVATPHRSPSPAGPELLDDAQPRAPRARVPRDLRGSRTDWPAGQQADLGAPPARALREPRWAEAVRGPAAEGRLHPPVLQRVVREDGQAAFRAQEAVAVREKAVEPAELVVDGDAQGLKRAGGGMDTRAATAEHAGHDGRELAGGAERTGAHDGARDGPRPSLLAVLGEQPRHPRPP